MFTRGTSIKSLCLNCYKIRVISCMTTCTHKQKHKHNSFFFQCDHSTIRLSLIAHWCSTLESVSNKHRRVLHTSAHTLSEEYHSTGRAEACLSTHLHGKCFATRWSITVRWVKCYTHMHTHTACYKCDPKIGSGLACVDEYNVVDSWTKVRRIHIFSAPSHSYERKIAI